MPVARPQRSRINFAELLTGALAALGHRRRWLGLSCALFFSLPAQPMPNEDFEQLRTQLQSAATSSPKQALQLVDQLLEQQQAALTLEQTIRLLYAKAWYQIRTDQAASALATLADCKALAVESDNPEILFNYFSLIAGLFQDQGMHSYALEYYRQAFAIADAAANQQSLRQTKNNIGWVLIELGHYSEAQQHFQRFLNYALEQGMVDEQSVALNNLGEVALRQGDAAAAMDFHQQALALRLEHGLDFHASWSYHNLARVALHQKQPEQAEAWLRKSLAVREQQGNLALSIPARLDLVRALMMQNALEPARQSMDQALLDLQQRPLDRTIGEAFRLSAELHEQQGHWQQAVIDLRQAAAAEQRWQEASTQLGLAHQIAQTSLATREAELRDLQRDQQIRSAAAAAERQTVWVGGLGLVTLLLVMLGFSLRLRRKNQTLAHTLDSLHQTQHRLIEARKMSALTTLVVGMAHQLNTPLGIVVTAISCCRDNLVALRQQFEAKQLSMQRFASYLGESMEVVELAERNSARASELIRRFKLISAGMDARRAETLDLKPLLSEALASLAEPHRLPIRVEVEGDDCALQTYPDTVIKVITLLFENSLAHGLDGQPNPLIRIEINQQGDQVRLVFEDNGSGIAADVGNKIFDPFYTTKMGQGSLGLGLSIAYNAVVHGLMGQIRWLPSETGARFEIILPQTLKAAEGATIRS